MRKFVYHLFMFLTIASAFMTVWMFCGIVEGNFMFIIPTILFGILTRAFYWFIEDVPDDLY